MTDQLKEIFQKLWDKYECKVCGDGEMHSNKFFQAAKEIRAATLKEVEEIITKQNQKCNGSDHCSTANLLFYLNEMKGE